MADDSQTRANKKPNEDAPDGSNSSFAWEFVNDEAHTQSTISSRQAVEGTVTPTKDESTSIATVRSSEVRLGTPTDPTKSAPTGTVRHNYVRVQLERAVERWSAYGEIPPLRLLRDGLLLLEADGSATEEQRTLLLRAALVYDRGIQTALRYQVDRERVAMVLTEALIEWEPPLDPEKIPKVLGEDDLARSLLGAELERSRIQLTGEGRLRAEAGLAVLSPSKEVLTLLPTPSVAASPQPVPIALTARRKLLRQILLLLLLITFVGFVVWQQRQVTPFGMVSMPAAEYAMLGASESDATTSARLDAFFVDRFEVTNALYRSCVDRGQCAWPKSTNSATRSDYFTNPAFNDYPVVNVTQGMASAFCAWQDKRLPTAEEWQAAASVSPNTGQAFRYPWGETFDPQRTNSVTSAIGDTVVVGSYRPAGNSASGTSDMAGNVAEWTATKDAALQPSDFAIVKGGGYANNADALTVGARASIESGGASPDVGFRCVRTHLLREK